MNKEPVKLTGVFKDYLWGGRKLKESYNKITELDKVAESWELSVHKDGESVIASGELAGCSLSEYIAKNEGCLGKRAEKFECFPILIKLIDACNKLSVQVHPNDEYAMREEKEYGKTEMWYVAECEEGATLYYGVNREITRDELKNRIADNTILEVLNEVKVKKGDVFFIEAGTIHAIGKGIVICEIQQNSNTTYRVYDYDRRDKDGNARELHIEKAIEVATLKPSEPFKAEGDLLADCKYFTVHRYNIEGKREIEMGSESFCSLTVTDGSLEMEIGENSIHMQKGETVFVPAQDGTMKFKGNGTVISARV